MKKRNMIPTDQKGHGGRRNYLVRIICILLGFLLLFTLLFVVPVHRRAQQYVRGSIEESNQLVLQQMKNDFLLFQENMEAVILSTFYRSDVYTLLYNTKVELSDVFRTLWEVSSDILTVQPSIYSIEFYNAVRGEWYSTQTYGLCAGAELERYLSQAEETLRLAPVLRKVTGSENENDYTYVLSYFMYEHQPPNTLRGSFMVVNQRAGWFVDALTQVSRSSCDTQALLVSSSGEIINYANAYLKDEYALLAAECMEKLADGSIEAEQGSYISSSAAEKYLISYLKIEKHGDMVLLLQNYDEVFANLQKLRNDFILILGLLALLGILTVWVMSKHLYKPVDELISYAYSLDSATGLQRGAEDEFSRLRSILKHAERNIKTLREQKDLRDGVLQKLMLTSLLRDAGDNSWQRYREILPDAPLCRQTQWRLAVAVAKIDYTDDNAYGFLASEEEAVQYAVCNIFNELMDGCMVEHIKQNEREIIFVVNLTPACDQTLEQKLDVLRVLAKEYLDVSLTLACSNEAECVSAMPSLYEQARTCLQYCMAFGCEQVLSERICRRNEENPDRTYQAASESRLMDCIRMQQTEKAMELLDSICEEVRRLRYELILVNVIELITRLKVCIGELYRVRDREQSTGFVELYSQVLHEETLDGIFQHIKAQVQKLLAPEATCISAEQRNRQFVEQVIGYIEQNYADCNLCLQSIAAYIGLSDRYISQKFKQCTDISINSYILGFRMKRAAELLLSTELSVNRVAQKIGIENENYFYHLFKKQFGCTPREFAASKRKKNR